VIFTRVQSFGFKNWRARQMFHHAAPIVSKETSVVYQPCLQLRVKC